MGQELGERQALEARLEARVRSLAGDTYKAILPAAGESQNLKYPRPGLGV